VHCKYCASGNVAERHVYRGKVSFWHSLGSDRAVQCAPLTLGLKPDAVQENLFAAQPAGEPIDAPAPSVGQSPTSEAAATKIEHSAETLREMVYSFVRSYGAFGATDDEIQRALSMSGDTERPRRWELVNDGRLMDSRRTRKTKRGRDATVWVVAG